ncbi:MAG: hypothetical protein Q4B43_09640, partial [Bacteroidota bacterium]|nr:hypothetical protein [Bacteroidota bacterium]
EAIPQKTPSTYDAAHKASSHITKMVETQRRYLNTLLPKLKQIEFVLKYTISQHKNKDKILAYIKLLK